MNRKQPQRARQSKLRSSRAVAVLDPSEDKIQCAYIDYCHAQRDERRFAFHIANEGKRFQPLAIRRGLRPGVSDNFVPAPRGGWHGLWLELKRKGEPLKPAQVQFGEDMQSCGYAFAWADNLDDAMRITDAYMAGQMPRPNWVHYEAPAKSP